MTELSLLWTTNGTGDGSSAGYTQVHWSGIGRVLAACCGFEGVAPGYANELECSDNGANTVAVDTGGAVVDGKPYTNGASEDVNIPSAVGAGNTRIDRLVLRASWAAQTVRITRIAGTDAATPSAPAITQTSGTTYDIQLCQVLVDTDGDVTVTDERTFAQGGANSLATGGVTVTKLGAAAVTSAKIASGAVVAGKLGASAVTGTKILAGAVTSTKIGLGAVTSTKLAADSVTGTAAGNRIIQIHRRQGGSSTDWGAAGGSSYTPSTVRAQTGVKNCSITDSEGATSVTFPSNFAAGYAPVVILTIQSTIGANEPHAVDLWPVSVSGTGFSIGHVRTGGQDGSLDIAWLAIGPE